MATPTRHTCAPPYEGGPRMDVWIINEGDVWQVWCMDCGTRLGHVDANDEDGARRATTKHDERMHL